ncbi:RTC4-like domain-containing protein [Colletotrichum navitas]|uniref:Restriction of telomere capping protein 4 n=1 Tax=Colletotrichum navitas TaxID=681940 RepID=A0AAD8VAR3_9PEZI|nr:RTC4-like domain-containing protein [Colletotrichum navitas]KAK1600692.1 RTC4-like domain-containing protein [Colletotrichum navitas]
MKSSQEMAATKRKKEGRSPSPKRPQPSFKAYDDDPFDQFSGKGPQKDLIKIPSLPSSPPGSPPRSKFQKHSSLSPSTSPRRTIEAKFKHPSGSLPEPLHGPTRGSADLLDLESSPEALYKRHKGEKDSFLDISDHSISDIDTETRCPMCSEIVEKALLEGFSGGARLHIRRQIQFCRLHKKKSAEDAWDARGYPKIDWGILDSRLATHYDFLRSIINGGSSHYASLLVDKVKEGKDRTLLKAGDSLTPGYYGPRGLRAMSESIIGNFSSVLRERAVEDRVISSRGYSSYVEAVLVPELAVQLICEDMEVKIDEARTILEESKWIGDLLHDDAGDTVDQLSDDEQAGGH